MTTVEKIGGREKSPRELIKSELENVRLDVLMELAKKEKLSYEEFSLLDKTSVDLSRKTELSNDECKFLVEYSNNHDGGYLNLRLTKLTDVQAKEIGKVRALVLDGVTSITDKQAAEMSKVKILYLGGLRTLTDGQAMSLRTVERLTLDGLKSITDKQAEYLSKVKTLSIDERILTDKQKKILGKIS